jgi:nucleotide-binding universal stress UspA family protein
VVKEDMMTGTTGRVTRKVVVGVDESACSKLAMRWGAYIAATMGAPLEAVAAWQYPQIYGGGYLPAAFDPGADAEKWLTAAVDEVFGQNRPTAVSLVVREGRAAPVLLHQCEDASMLIVGSRGYGGFVGLLLGSVSAAVAEHAKCPVLVVHGDKRPPDIWS